MKNVFGSLILGLFVVSCSGCAALLVGAGVAGGVAISKDTARLDKDKNFDTAWSVTYKTLKEMGDITLQDKHTGKIEATIQEAKVIASIKTLTQKTTRIEIKSRKNLLPCMELAIEIINTLNQRL
jgi:hypothetical protein